MVQGKLTDRTAISAAMEKAQSIFDSGDQSAIAEFNYIFAELDQNVGLS